MFRRLDDSATTERDVAGQLIFEARPVPFRAGDSVAAALLLAGIGSTRDGAVDGSPRAPYCMMGLCFECLVEIDGVQNRQSCLTPARAGMVVRRQRGAREIR